MAITELKGSPVLLTPADPQQRSEGLTRPRRRWMAGVLIVDDLPMPDKPRDRRADGTSP
jgi:hypothetical protein